MEIQLGALSQLLGGELTDPSKADVTIDNVSSLDDAGPRDLAFLWDPKYTETAKTCQAGAIVTKDAVEGRTCILVPDPQRAMLDLLGQVYAMKHPAPPAGVHPQAFVDPSATLGEGVSVGPHAVVDANATLGNNTQVRPMAYVGRSVRTGEGCVIHPHATVLDHTVLGDRVVIWSGAIVGKDGFGFIPESGDGHHPGRHLRVPQIGNVELGDDVEIGALTTVAKGALASTKVGRGAKIDDHCHVAHNCDLGENVMLIGYARMGGSVTIGKDAYLLQDSAVGQGRTVGTCAVVGSGAKARYNDVPPGETILGDPARPHMLTKRIEGSLPKLPEMRRRLRSLERRVDKLHPAD